MLLGKIIFRILFQIFLCVCIILTFKLSAIKNFASEPWHDVAGATISVAFLVSNCYLIYFVKAQRQAEAFLMTGVLTVLGIIGYGVCFAAVYYLHGINCPPGGMNGDSFGTALFYSFYIRLVNQDLNMCSPKTENSFIPYIQIVFTYFYVFLVGGFESLKFLRKEK